jgi:hypothetical protein
LPPQTDHSDGPSTLPTPELNPLLNPLLGQNMGRWAEVYFTSPPEKREQAVLELLRELQAENPQHDVAFVEPPSAVFEQASQPAAAPSLADALQSAVPCHRCGRENPASHRFCGMCGNPLAEQPAATGVHVADLHVADLHVADLHVSDLHIENQVEDGFIENPPQDHAPSSADVAYEPTLNANELSLFHRGRDDRSDEIFSDPPASRSYRVYVGIALAIVIFALGYMAWRGVQAPSGSLEVARQAPPVATATQPAEPAPPSTSKAAMEEQPLASPPAADAAPHDAATDAASGEAAAKGGRNAIAKDASSTTPAIEKNPPAETVAGNGAEELALAQSYLNGAHGEPRNSTEAAKWLWKAMAKHNGGATLLLADLYLKGDGVPKNCDQARILLDSAALRGIKDAAERLRHLQAFGCN